MKKIKSVMLITALNNNNKIEHTRDQKRFSLFFKERDQHPTQSILQRILTD